MANFNIAFDNNNADIGHYFEGSKDDLISHIHKVIATATINEINSGRCNQAYIDVFIPTINHLNFIFVAYSHGHSTRLVAGGGYYIESDANANLFTNSFFYSMACHTGSHLGIRLVDTGCHAFIGYKDTAYALLDGKMQLSVDCDNHGIKNFIDGATLAESFESMKSNFTAQIDNLEAEGEPLIAAYLRRNRDALVFIGNGSLRITDFSIN